MSTREIVQQFTETLRKTQFLQPDALQTYQRNMLQRLVRHARAHVPFYRDTGRLDPVFRHDDTIDWSRWREIPPLTRADLQAGFDRLKSDFTPPEHGRHFMLSTAGSTGEPIRVLQTAIALHWAWAALRLRDHEWHGVDPTKRLAFLYPFTSNDFDIAGIRRLSAWRPEFKALGLLGERIEIADTRPVSELVEVIAAERPSYLQVQPTTLQLMIAHDRAGRLADLHLAAVISYGEYFPPDSKREIEARLGCKVIEVYGSSETNNVAGSCPHCGRFHIYSEVCLVEVLSDDGEPAAPGETGRMLITPFYNYLMPLIRYDHNDFARAGAPGGCAITLPALDEIIGKKRNPFVFPGGRVIRPTVPTDAVIDFLGAQIFQVAQVAPDRCEFRFVPGRLAPGEMRFEEMTKTLRANWWDGLQVEYKIVESFPRRTARSKHQVFVREFDGADNG